MMITLLSLLFMTGLYEVAHIMSNTNFYLFIFSYLQITPTSKYSVETSVCLPTATITVCYRKKIFESICASFMHDMLTKPI